MGNQTSAVAGEVVSSVVSAATGTATDKSKEKEKEKERERVGILNNAAFAAEGGALQALLARAATLSAGGTGSGAGGGGGVGGAQSFTTEDELLLAGCLDTQLLARVKPPRSVRLFVSAAEDFLIEKNALHSIVFPFLSKFAALLNLDFAVIDSHWNLADPAIHNNAEMERSILSLEKTFDDDHIPIFIAFLGDKYGSPVLPSTLPIQDFTQLRENLLTLPEPTPTHVAQVLDLWYTRDDNASVYRLRPVESILTAFNSPNADNDQRSEAQQLWAEIEGELARLLKTAGLVSCGRSLVEVEVDAANMGKRKEGVFCFQRTLLDLKRNASENPHVARQYIDLDPSTNEPIKESAAEITRLRSKHRATRFYAIPWLSSPSSPSTQTATPSTTNTRGGAVTAAAAAGGGSGGVGGGFDPRNDKQHATYLTTLCEDVAKVVCESIVKQWRSRVGASSSSPPSSSSSAASANTIVGPVGEEVARHSLAVVKEVERFVGRVDVVKQIEEEFLGWGHGGAGGAGQGKVLVLYGPSGVGKTALMSKIAHRIYETQPETALIIRLVGTTAESHDSRALLRSMCAQIVGIYGASELKDKVEFEGAMSHELAEATGEPTLQEKLGNLDHWPPVSYEGLKAGFEVALKLADELRPLILVIDALDELNVEDETSTTLDWLPTTIPPHVKILLSTAPTSPRRKQSTYSIISQIYPVHKKPLEYAFFEVPFLEANEVSLMVDSLAVRSQRTLQPEQKLLLLYKCEALELPLYVRAAWTLHAEKWTSYTSIDAANKAVNAETVPGLVEDFFDALEVKLGRYFVARALAYLTAARQGVGRVEWEDLLSCDETVMNEVFKFKEMSVRRLPPIYLDRLLEELGETIVEKQVYGVRAFFWAHRQFHLLAEDRYLEQGQAPKIHSAFSAYWESKYAGTTPKLYNDLSTGLEKKAPRYCVDQSLLTCGKPNARRISAIAWHQLQIGKSGFRAGTKTLQDISHLGTAVHAGLLWDVLASFRFAMSLEWAEQVVVDQLNDYYRFLLENAEVLLYDPNRLVPTAANLYAGSVVADEARKWILSNSPGLNWVEWSNRPTARGEPIVTLRGTDGGSATDVMMVTGRDTYDDQVVLVGVRSFDNHPSVFLYDIGQIEAASVGGGKAKLLAKRYLNSDPRGELVEPGVAMCVSFSRSGKQIAVAARTLIFLDASDLSFKKYGRDPTLPDGDLITAVAWTAKDGCIVSASDGSQPGRIGLWDAGSLTLLKVIQADLNPRQPFTSAFNHLGFWDEGKEQFVLANVDELAMDPDGTEYLQYIHNKPHCNPAPDSCARFAISFQGNYAIVAEETGRGYLLIDMNAKRPVARLEVEVDKVRYIALSHDGKRVAVVPSDNKVIFIHGITEESKPSKDGLNLYTYQHLGTILGVDPILSDGSQVGCKFSRSGKTILTDGEFGSVRVWNVNELGDHAVVRYTSTLPAAFQGVVPIKSSETKYLGWAVNEDNAVISISDKKASLALQSTYVSGEKRLRRSGFSRKDIVTGIASHPSKPIVATVTNNGNITLLYAEQAFHDKGWTGALRSAFSRKFDGGYSIAFNIMAEGGYISPSCISFLNSTSAVTSGAVEGATSELLSFVVGYEDGTVSVWDWNPATSISGLVPTVILKLSVGRVTSITATNISSSRRVAMTVEDSTVLLWDGVTPDPQSVQVLVPPASVTNSYISMGPGPTKLKNRRSVTSIMSITGLLERNSDQAVAVAFSNTQEQLLASGETDGMVTIWNTEAKVKRSLLIHSNDILPAPITAIAWASDDAALVSVTEDKRVAIHNTVTGNIVWIHDLWMISPRINSASFANGARELVVLDHDGVLTSVQLHGDWPTATNADVFSPLKATNNLSLSSHHPTIRHKGAFPSAPEPEFAEFAEWGPEVSRKLLEARAIKNSRTTYQWEYSTGSKAHGHVALIRLNEGLPRGCYQVVCNVEVTTEPTVPLKFLCWTTGDADVIDPELDVIHGFSRLFPLEEQRELIGKGTVTLRLGYLKTSCKLENCCIDLTRLPGDGEPISFGDVHFLPVDPTLYRPDYVPTAELADAFDHLTVDFDEFEYSQGRRNSHIGVPHMNEHLQNTDFPDLVMNPFDFDVKSKALYDNDLGVATNGNGGGEVMWEFGQDDEMSDSFTGGDVVSNMQVFESSGGGSSTKKKSNRRSMRMSVMESIAGVKSGVTGVVGGVLSAAAAALPAGVGVPSTQSRTKASPEDIAREMEEARKRGREQARMFEEAEEFKASQAAKQREWMARRLEFEQDAKRRAMLIQMQKQVSLGRAVTASPTDYDDDSSDDDLEGVDEDIKREARRIMREMLQKEMEHDLEKEED